MEDNAKLKQKVKLFLKIFVSLFFIWLVLEEVNWKEALVYFRRVEIWHILVYLAVVLLAMVVSAWKWKILADHKKFQLSFSRFFELYITGAFINNFVPSVVGGDFYRSYNLGKKDKRYFEATSTVVFDRFSGLVSLLIMIPIFSFLDYSKMIDSPPLFLINWTSLVVLLVLISFIFLRKKKWLRKIAGRLPEKIKNFIKELEIFGDNWKIIFFSLVFSVLFNLIGVALANLILFWSLGIKVDPFNYLPAIFTISIISAIPAGVGLKEWAYMTLFGFSGVDPSGAVAVAILNRFLQALVNLMALPIYFKNKQ